VKRVLVVEDDADIGTLIKATVEERLGVTADLVTNGALVSDQLAAARPDLLILDVNIPGMNGLDVFDLVRGGERWEGPVLFLTAVPERALRAFARSGVREIMRKPFDLDELTARVRELLARADQRVG
jgi:DNA-binding response OmpR family regulator